MADFQRPTKPTTDSLMLFGEATAQWRQLRGLSQRRLGKVVGHSQRHISFLETGRARPSRETVERIVHALQIPPRDGNQLLGLLGFGDVFHDGEGDPEAFGDTLKTVGAMLINALRPSPAAILDDAHRIVLMNVPYAVWCTRFGLPPADEATAIFVNDRLDFPSLIFHPGGLVRHAANWEAFARGYLQAILRLRLSRPEIGDRIVKRVRALATVPDSWLVLNDAFAAQGPLEIAFVTPSGDICFHYLPVAVATPEIQPTEAFPGFSFDLLRPSGPASRRFCEDVSAPDAIDRVHPLLLRAVAPLQDPAV